MICCYMSVNTLMQKANNIACFVIQMMMMMDILRCKRRHEHVYRKNAFLTFCRGLQKNDCTDKIVSTSKRVECSTSKCYVQQRSSKKPSKKDIIIEYKDIIFGVDTPFCTESLNELQKQQVNTETVYRKKLLEDTVRKLAWDNIAEDG